MYKIKTQQEEVKQDKVVTLRLEQDSIDRDTVNLMAVDESGEDWYVLKFLSNGNVECYIGIPANIGIPVDEDGSIVITVED